MFGIFKKFEPFILNVPYAEKDEAKSLGAQWNPKIQKWYAPSQKVKDKCKKWQPADIEGNQSSSEPKIANETNGFKLDVPFEEKDAAKDLGAKWNADEKTWYAPTEAIRQKCEKWLPLTEPTISQTISGPFEILVSSTKCYRCDAVSKVAAITVSGIENSADEVLNSPLILTHIEHLEPPFIAMLQSYNHGFSKKHSNQLGRDVWMNCCDSCGAHFGDFFMMNEPGGAFHPTSSEEARNIQRGELVGSLPDPAPYRGEYTTDFKESF